MSSVQPPELHCHQSSHMSANSSQPCHSFDMSSNYQPCSEFLLLSSTQLVVIFVLLLSCCSPPLCFIQCFFFYWCLFLRIQLIQPSLLLWDSFLKTNITTFRILRRAQLSSLQSPLVIIFVLLLSCCSPLLCFIQCFFFPLAFFSQHPAMIQPVMPSLVKLIPENQHNHLQNSLMSTFVFATITSSRSTIFWLQFWSFYFLYNTSTLCNKCKT